jgi:excisionase family DNA binding protein
MQLAVVHERSATSTHAPAHEPLGAPAMSSETLDRFRPKPTRERAVYTVQEVADMLGLALHGTYTLLREGTIPSVRAGSRWLIPKTRFHAWLDGLDDPPELGEPAGRWR